VTLRSASANAVAIGWPPSPPDQQSPGPFARIFRSIPAISVHRIGREIPKMMSKDPLMQLWTRLFPELVRFPDARGRAAVWNRASGSIVRSGRFWLLLVVTICVSFVAAGRVFATPYIPHAPFVICLVMVPSAYLMFALVFRVRITRRLRQELRARGIIICLRCGYDLRGSPGRSCPECGAPVGGRSDPPFARENGCPSAGNDRSCGPTDGKAITADPARTDTSLGPGSPNAGASRPRDTGSAAGC